MDLSKLNDKQKKAVTTIKGAVLVLAGAGSGKTSVLTTRAAYLIENGVAPFSILALTFTNKAASEMKQRITALVPDAGSMWISTFHAMCAKLLRIEGSAIGYDSSFSIYDSSDSLTVVKECLKELDIAKDFIDPKTAKYTISRAKNDGISPQRYVGEYGDGSFFKMMGRVYARYENKLKASNALDFDDLLLKVLDLFADRPDILKKYQDRFEYIMVDEYQDTNQVQYDIVSKLAAGSGNIFVVGDDDQSIYGWRGANIDNILEFEKDFPGAAVIRMEQNYRSHQHILNAANRVICNNEERLGKQLWSDVTSGQKPLEFEAQNDGEEAIYVATKIDSILREGKYKPSDIAILYRINSQSRILENKLKERGLPYEIYGGLSFYDRREIKDIIAYLNLICNESANLCFVRAVGMPKRGIGPATVDKINTLSYESGRSYYEVAKDASRILPKKAAATLDSFTSMIEGIKQRRSEQSVLKTVEEVLEFSGMQSELLADKSPEGRMRYLNVEEFLKSVDDWEKQAQEPKTLEAFLERNALVSDVDNVGDNDDAVMLMTLHSAKGLEFPIVFIVGMQEGLLPHQMSLQEGDVEEERRLCYVGMTRAKRRLYLTWSSLRFVRSGAGFTYVSSQRSRFLDEIPEECIETAKVKKPGRGLEAAAKIQSPFSLGHGKVSAPSFTPAANKKAEHNPDAFSAGTVVTHPKFGKGKVVSTNGDGEEKIAVVNFETVGEKKMFVAFAPLKIS